MDLLSMVGFIKKEDINSEMLIFTVNQSCLAVYTINTE